MRRGTCKRKTKETDINVSINLDGSGKGTIDTSVPFMDHMLSQVAMHGKFDITIKAKGDIDIDFHHLVEDLGICLGEAFKKAVAEKKGIERYGEATVPLNEALVSTVADISGRPFLVYNVNITKEKIGEFDAELAEEFFHAFTNHSGVTLHVNLISGKNMHHILEAAFKSFGRALKVGVKVSNSSHVPSTKGKL